MPVEQPDMQWKLIKELTDAEVLGMCGRSDKPPRRTARAILRNADGLYALMYFEKFDLYSLPGGGIDEGETEIQALTREISEETGCGCDEIIPLGTVAENRFHADYTAISYFFVVNTRSGQGDVKLTAEEEANGTRVIWRTLDEAMRLIGDKKPDTNQQKFLQARDMAALREYKMRYID